MPKFKLSFASQRDKLILKFFKDGKQYRAKSTGIPFKSMEDAENSPSLALILSNYQSQFDKAIYEYELTGIEPHNALIPPEKEAQVIPTPKEFFTKEKCKIFADYLDAETAWDELIDGFVEDFVTEVNSDDYTDNTIKAYLHSVRKCFDRAARLGYSFPSLGYKKLLSHKEGTTTSIFLDMKEIALLEDLRCEDVLEESVRVTFLKACYSGCRYSDVHKLKLASIIEVGYHAIDGTVEMVKSISYVSQKTNTLTNVPLKSSLVPLLKMEVVTPSNGQMNRILPELCLRAGITAPAEVFKCGKLFTGEKWEFVRSHTARKSFATNLYIMGCSIRDISKYVGHKDEATTLKNYIRCGAIYNKSFINGFFG